MNRQERKAGLFAKGMVSVRARMRILLLSSLFFALIVTGCQSVTEYDQNPGIDVFEAPGQKPSKPIKLLGEITDDGPLIKKADLQAMMVKRAKKRGADFIILHEPVPAGVGFSPFGGAQQTYLYRGQFGKYQQ
jgi:hypothetical protein